MRTRGTWLTAGAVLLFVLFVGLVPHWRAPGPGFDVGPPGQAMVQFLPPESQARALARPAPALAPTADDPRPATAAFRNVKVLTDLNAGDFMRVQAAMTAWVAPKRGPDQGCGFCHAGADYASDAKPQKAAARVMLAMTRRINGQWRSHVGAAGVTCFSCHQGRPVPENVWFQSPPRPRPKIAEAGDDWIESSHTVHGFFPTEGFEEYLLQAMPAHGQALTTLPAGTTPSFTEAKRLYEAMMQMSDGMGVNCGYCHASRNFADWGQSTPMRWSGQSGIAMTRELNRDFILHVGDALPLVRPAPPRDASLPARMRGPQAGAGLADCGTCHRGAPRPHDAAAPAGGFPGLTAPAATTPVAAPATVAAAAPRPPAG